MKPHSHVTYPVFQVQHGCMEDVHGTFVLHRANIRRTGLMLALRVPWWRLPLPTEITSRQPCTQGMKCPTGLACHDHFQVNGLMVRMWYVAFKEKRILLIYQDTFVTFWYFNNDTCLLFFKSSDWCGFINAVSNIPRLSQHLCMSLEHRGTNTFNWAGHALLLSHIRY